jgi:hypothetical protein
MGLSCTAGGRINWYSHFGKLLGRNQLKLNMHMPYNWTVAILGRQGILCTKKHVLKSS